MHLLTPDDIKNDKDNELERRRSLIASIASEEARVNRDLNAARENDIAERTRMQREFGEFESEINQRRVDLSREVAALEARRADALKPIETKREEANAALEQNKKDAALLREQESALREKGEAMIARIEGLSEKEQEVSERGHVVEKEEARITDEKERLHQSQLALADKWTQYHEQVNKTNKIVEEVLLEIEAGKLANSARARSLDDEHERLRQMERRVTDGHAMIQKHMKTLGIISF